MLYLKLISMPCSRYIYFLIAFCLALTPSSAISGDILDKVIKDYGINTVAIYLKHHGDGKLYVPRGHWKFELVYRPRSDLLNTASIARDLKRFGISESELSKRLHEEEQLKKQQRIEKAAEEKARKERLRIQAIHNKERERIEEAQRKAEETARAIERAEEERERYTYLAKGILVCMFYSDMVKWDKGDWRVKDKLEEENRCIRLGRKMEYSVTSNQVGDYRKVLVFTPNGKGIEVWTDYFHISSKKAHAWDNR